MRTKLLSIQWPQNGLHQGLAVQTQAPYTTPDCLNVRPVDVMTGRRRGGSRPGLMRSHGPQLGSGNPIRLLASVNHVQTDQFQYWTDGFDGDSIASVWDSSATPLGSRAWTQDGSLAYVTGSSTTGGIRSDITTLSVANSAVHEVGLWVVPGMNSATDPETRSFNGAVFDLYACCAGASPPVDTTANGIRARLTFTGATTYSATLVYVNGGAENSTSLASGASLSTAAKAFWFSLRITKSSGTVATAAVYIDGVQVGSSVAGIGVSTSRRFGFAMSTTGIRAQAEAFRVQYTDTGAQQLLRPVLVASSNGLLYREKLFGRMEQVTTTARSLTTSQRIFATDRGQKLYIADAAFLKVEEVTPTGVNSNLSSVAVAGDVIYISKHPDYPLNDTIAGSYLVRTGSTVTPNYFPTTGTPAHASKVLVYTFRQPLIYDPVAGTTGYGELQQWMSSGSTDTPDVVPAGCRLICRYRDRIVLAGDVVNPHVWYMSRQGDPNDWDFGETDVGRAVSGSAENSSGRVGDPITAIVPYFDDFLIFGCKDSLHILRGDPAYGGQIDVVSNEVGIVDAGAYCFGPGGEIIFLTRQGVYMANADCSTCLPISSSTERVPTELIDVDSNLYDVSMAWDQRDGGIHLWLNPKTGTVSGLKCWWIDWETKSYWPVTPASTSFYPSTIWQHKAADPIDSAVVFGCRDGYLRKHYDWCPSDDGTNFSDHIVLGPFRPGGSDWHDGILAELVGTAASGGGSLAWSVMRAATAESVLDETSALFTGEWPSGRSYTSHPRARGGAFKLKLSGQSHPWSFEQATMLLRMSGKQRIR